MKNVHPVYGAMNQTHGLQNMSLLPQPLDQGSTLVQRFRPTTDGMFGIDSLVKMVEHLNWRLFEAGGKLFTVPFLSLIFFGLFLISGKWQVVPKVWNSVKVLTENVQQSLSDVHKLHLAPIRNIS